MNNISCTWSRRILRSFYLVLMILLFAGIVKGQTDMPDSLRSYLEIAAKNNPAVQQKFNEYMAAMQKAPQAGGLPDPEFSFGVFVKPMELLGGNQVADFQLMQMFPWFGTLHSARDEASLMAKAKFESFRDTKQEVWFNVRKAWLELYLNQARISITQKNLAILKAIERIAVNRFSTSTPGATSSGNNPQLMQNQPGTASGNMPGNVTGNMSGSKSIGQAGANSSLLNGNMTGSGTMNETGNSSDLISLYRIQIETGDMENLIADWKTQETVLKSTMNSFLNRKSDDPVALADTLIPYKPDGSFITIRDSILARNTMLTMLSAEKQAYDERIRMSKRMSYPMFGLGVDYMLINARPDNTSMMNGKDMIIPMGKVTLPIYRGKYTALRKEAEFLSMAAVNQISAAQNSLTVEYHDMIKMFEDANRRIQLYTRQTDLAQKTMNLMIVEFSVSGKGLDELLKIEQQLLEYELVKTEAIVENNIAIAGLDRLMARTDALQTDKSKK